MRGGEASPRISYFANATPTIFVNVYLLEPLLSTPRSLGLPSFGSIVVLLEGVPEVPLPIEPVPELPLPEPPDVELPVDDPPLRGLPWFFSSTVLSRLGAPLAVPELLRLAPPIVEPLLEATVTPNALVVLLSSCPEVWIFCAR